jgi:HD-GYP domain-containing protein (c-di-GMP phosphodiesterase class II)
MAESSFYSLDSIKPLLAAINCGALLLDRSGVVVHVNHRLCEMMQRSCGQIVGTNVLDLYTESSDREVIQRSLQNFDHGSEFEFFIPLPGGGRLPIISSARPLPGPPPLSDHRLITVIDISAQKKAEKTMKEQYDFIASMSDTVLQQAIELKHNNQTLEQRVRERTNELRQAHMDAILMLAVASEAKDEATGLHVKRVEQCSRDLSRRLGFSESDAEAIGYSSILHDVGKIHVPDEILAKPGPLDERERARMQLHTLAGERILGESSFFEQARKIARGHHENWDGSGYPDGLARHNIPIESRIVHLVDVFDALIHKRVYKEAWTRKQAIAAIQAGRGTMFDPEIVDAFSAFLPDGRTVLASDKLYFLARPH